MKNSIYLLLVLALSFSCKKDNGNRVIDANTVLKEMKWHQNNVLDFEVIIANDSLTYDLSLNIRNGLDYPFRNIYFLYSIEDEKGSLVFADQQELFLFDKQGRPFGDADSFVGVSYGDIYYSSTKFAKYKFAKKGTYHIKIVQNMRNTPVLDGVMSVGIKVSK